MGCRQRLSRVQPLAHKGHTLQLGRQVQDISHCSEREPVVVIDALVCSGLAEVGEVLKAGKHPHIIRDTSIQGAVQPLQPRGQ